MVARPDWNVEGGAAPAVAASTAVAPLTRPDWSLPAEESSEPIQSTETHSAMDPATGLPADFVRDLERSPDGLERSVDHLREAITMRFGDDRDRVVSWFEELSPGLQAKALHVFMHNSGAPFDDLVKRVKRRATLSEDAELTRWLEKADE